MQIVKKIQANRQRKQFLAYKFKQLEDKTLLDRILTKSLAR